MMSHATVSDLVGLSANLEKNSASDDQWAVTVPLARNSAQRKYDWQASLKESVCKYCGSVNAVDALSALKEPVGCKDCGCVNCVEALYALKGETIEQTKKRWDWFSDARKLDDESSKRLGTLGKLPYEIRAKIFRQVLDLYVEEVNLPCWGNADVYTVNMVCSQSSQTTRRSRIFTLLPFYLNPAIFMPLRLASIDTGLEFDRIYLSTMKFRFSCPKSLGQFLKDLSTTQLSQVRSIVISVLDCYHCLGERTDKAYRDWELVWSQLPSTLVSIKFEGCRGRRDEDSSSLLSTKSGHDLKDFKRAKFLLKSARKGLVGVSRRRNPAAFIWSGNG